MSSDDKGLALQDSPGEKRRYALTVANDSHKWYTRAAIRSRRLHRFSEVAILVASAGIPIGAVLLPGNTTFPAILGAIVVITTGLRSSFQWHENYLRFSQAREAVEGERRKFRIGIPPYDSDSSSALFLVQNISAIESSEMSKWLDVVAANRQSDRENSTSVSPNPQ